MSLIDACAEDSNGASGLLHTGAGLEPPDHLVRVGPAFSQIVGILRHHGNPDFGSPGQAAEAGGEHPHNRVASSVQPDGPSDNPGISSETSLPYPMSQQRHEVSLRSRVFFRKKDPPQLSPDSEER